MATVFRRHPIIGREEYEQAVQQHKNRLAEMQKIADRALAKGLTDDYKRMMEIIEKYKKVYRMYRL